MVKSHLLFRNTAPFSMKTQDEYRIFTGAVRQRGILDNNEWQRSPLEAGGRGAPFKRVASLTRVEY